jgi:hypothetical protein
VVGKIKLVALALILLQSLAGQYVFAALAQICATRADITVPLTGNSPVVNNTNSEPPQSNVTETVIQHLNGTKTVIITINEISRTRDTLLASASYVTVNFHYPFWAFLENLFDLMQNINGELSLMLVCVFCVLELRKKFPKPFLSS